MANIQSGGAVDITANHKPSGGFYLTTTQSNLTNGINVKVELATIYPDFTDAIEDVENHKIVPGVAGLYHIKGQVHFTGVVALKDYQAKIYIDGGAYMFKRRIHSANAENIMVAVSAYYWLSNTSYIELFAVQSSGGDTVDIQSGYDTHLFVQRVR